MTLYLKGHQKYDRSKLKVQLLLSKFRLFNFDLSYLLYPLRYKVTQYLIRKLSDMVKMGIKGLAVAALLISVKASQKLKIYYINWALSKLNCYALYERFHVCLCLSAFYHVSSFRSGQDVSMMRGVLILMKYFRNWLANCHIFTCVLCH